MRERCRGDRLRRINTIRVTRTPDETSSPQHSRCCGRVAPWATASLDAGVIASAMTTAIGISSAARHKVMKTVQRRSHKHWFADLKAEALAFWVRRTSDQRVESVIRSRVRSFLLWLIFRTIRQRAQPDPHVNAVVEFRITGRRDGGVDRYRLALTGGRASKSGLAGQAPALTLELEPVAFLWLAGGTASPQRLLITRKLKLHGDLLLALALPTALRLPASRPRPSKH